MKARKRSKMKKQGFKLRLLFAMGIFAVIIIMLTRFYEYRVMPSVKKTMEHYGLTAATKIIDNSVKTVINDFQITSQDLYNKSTNANGKLTSLSADTVLINNLCAGVSEAVLEELSTLENENVYLPVGVLTGYDFLAAKGPRIFKIAYRPMGECTVDYDTSFKSEGINQVNYQIWLNVKTRITIVNPLTNQNISVVRKIPIVNTYINGDVPETMMYPYFDTPGK